MTRLSQPTPSPPSSQPLNLNSTLATGNASLASLKTALTTANWTSLKAAAPLPAIDLAAARAKVVSQLPAPPSWFVDQAPAGDMTCYVDPSSGRVTGLAQGGQVFGYSTSKAVNVPLSTSTLVDVEFVLTAPTTVGSFMFWVVPDGGKKAVPVLCGVKPPTPKTAFSAAGGATHGGSTIVELTAGFNPPTAAGSGRRRRRLAQTGGAGGGAPLSTVSVAVAPAGGGGVTTSGGGGAFNLVPSTIPLDGPCTVHQYNGPDTGGVSCQNCLFKPVDQNSQVTAGERVFLSAAVFARACGSAHESHYTPLPSLHTANFSNVPSYNAQCGKCLQVVNLNQTDAPPLFFTVIDYKGDPGLDLNQGYTYARWSSIYQYGKVPCKWAFVDASNCPWTPNVDR